MTKKVFTFAVRKHIETPEDFKKCIDEIPGANGRELRCEVIDDVFDWQEFLVAADTHLSGHTIAHAMESVNHAFRFIKRSDLNLYKGSESWPKRGEGQRQPCDNQRLNLEHGYFE